MNPTSSLSFSQPVGGMRVSSAASAPLFGAKQPAQSAGRDQVDLTSSPRHRRGGLSAAAIAALILISPLLKAPFAGAAEADAPQGTAPAEASAEATLSPANSNTNIPVAGKLDLVKDDKGGYQVVSNLTGVDLSHYDHYTIALYEQDDPNVKFPQTLLGTINADHLLVAAKSGGELEGTIPVPQELWEKLTDCKGVVQTDGVDLTEQEVQTRFPRLEVDGPRFFNGSPDDNLLISVDHETGMDVPGCVPPPPTTTTAPPPPPPPPTTTAPPPPPPTTTTTAPPPPTTVLECRQRAGLKGDPVITGFNDVVVNFPGTIGQNYIWHTTKSLELQGEITNPGGDGHNVGKAYLNYGQNQEIVWTAGSTPTIQTLDGSSAPVPMEAGQEYVAADGSTAVFDGETITVTTADGQVATVTQVVSPNYGPYLDGTVDTDCGLDEATEINGVFANVGTDADLESFGGVGTDGQHPASLYTGQRGPRVSATPTPATTPTSAPAAQVEASSANVSRLARAQREVDARPEIDAAADVNAAEEFDAELASSTSDDSGNDDEATAAAMAAGLTVLAGAGYAVRRRSQQT